MTTTQATSALDREIASTEAPMPAETEDTEDVVTLGTLQRATFPADDTRQLHGFTLIPSPRRPNGQFRVEVIDAHGNVAPVDGDTPQHAMDLAEGWVETRHNHDLWMAKMRSPRCTCDYDQHSCGVHGKLPTHGAA